MDRTAFPPFDPHPWLRDGHRQTVAGWLLPGPNPRLRATYHEVPLPDGDRLSVLETVPEGWRAAGPAALMVHGLAGCARSAYLVRVAVRLVGLGVRVVRMNLRGAGSGFGIARGTYHSGRTEDVRQVAFWLGARAPGAPIALVGFSLGGNLVLRLAAEAADTPVPGLDCVVAANPPIDLAASCLQIQTARGGLYDRNFVRLLTRDIRRLHAQYPDLGPVDYLARVRTLYDFDQLDTARRHGFAGADAYYDQCSAAPILGRIAVPGLVVHAEDDPFIPPDAFRRAIFPSRLALELIPSGGHLGFLARGRAGGFVRWLDARLTAWLASRWAEVIGGGEPKPPDAARRPRYGGLPTDASRA